MSTLSKLKLADAKHSKPENTPEQRRRDSLRSHLREQFEMIRAMTEGQDFKPKKVVREKDENGHAVTVERPKRVRPWYWHDLSNNWFLEVRYANKPLALAKDQTVIEVGAKDNLLPTIQTLIAAVDAGELDAAMKATLAARKKVNKSL